MRLQILNRFALSESRVKAIRPGVFAIPRVAACISGRAAINRFIFSNISLEETNVNLQSLSSIYGSICSL